MPSPTLSRSTACGWCCDDGTWGLVRASSNKPELVVVVESPVSEEMMKAMFRDIDEHLSHYPDVGEYNQKIA